MAKLPMRARTKAIRPFADIAKHLIGTPIECVKCSGECAHIIGARLFRETNGAIGPNGAYVEVEALCVDCGYETIFYQATQASIHLTSPAPAPHADSVRAAA